MTEEQAKAQCGRFAAEHPDRETHRWVPVGKGGDEWTVAKIGLAPAIESTSTEVRAQERPSPEDPRSKIPWQNPPSGIA